MIIREKYLSKIRPFYDQDLIKVITDIRRCGKSVILTQIMNEFKRNGIDEGHIIYINLELKEHSHLKYPFKKKFTGSNSDLLSSELATHIAGRYVSFKVFSRSL